MKKLSILLSCYKGDTFIESYIENLLVSRYVDYTTLVAINFPFSHQNPEFIESQIRRYPDVVLVNHSDNISLYEAWNQAIRLSTTPYVANLNLDDRVAFDYYEGACEVLDIMQADVYSSRAYATDSVGEKNSRTRLQEHLADSRFGIDGIAEYGISDLVSIREGQIKKLSIPHCAPVWRRNLHEEHGFFDCRRFDFCADFEFWLRVAAGGGRFVLQKQTQTIFYQAPDTASDRLLHEKSSKIIEFWSSVFPPPNYTASHLGLKHDQLHYCLNLNAIFSRKEYFAHLDAAQISHIQSSIDLKRLEKLHFHLETKPFNIEAGDCTRRIAEFRDCLRGGQALLLCNGPSLNQVDFSKVDATELTIVGLNKIFLGFEKFKIKPRFLVGVNKKVLEQSVEQLNKLNITKFVSNRISSDVIPNDASTYRVNTVNLPKGAARFSLNPPDYIYEGWTVTHSALQILLYMGVKKVFIVGMDHRFSQHVEGAENKSSIIAGEDKDHFSPNYFGGGQSWDFPDLANSEISYQAALNAFVSAGGVVYDCTVNGACKIFPKLPIEVVYKDSMNRESDLHKVANPQISVICPFKNPGIYFSSAIASVLNQVGVALELLLIDDHSEDYSLDLAESWSRVEPRIRVLVNRYSRGVAGARNTGLDEARGEFIAFLDADDYFDKGALAARLTAIKRLAADLVHSTLRMISKEEHELGIIVGKRKTCSFMDAETNPAHLNSVMGRASLLRRFRFKEGLANGEDWLYLASILRSGIKSHYVENAGAVYRIHSSSAVMSAPLAHDDTLTQVVEWLYSPCMEDFAAPEFRGPLSKSNKETVLLSRKLNSFFTQLFRGKDDSIREYVENVNFINFLSQKCVEELIGTMQVPFVRTFQIPMANAGTLKAEIAASILRVVLNCGLNDIFPNLMPALSKVFLNAGDVLSASTDLLGPFIREMHVHFDETDVVAAYLVGKSPHGSMIDIGAHQGSALAPFLENDWKIWAFEPDHQNRAKLQQRLSNHRNKGNVQLETGCVSNKSQKGVPFYQSEESTGISGLSAFRATHKEAQRVDTVSLADYFQGQEMPVVDFLKIDTEGHDLFVLQGFPWERNRPKVIECEFEDLKTKPLGYRTKDMADFLVGKGYTVYVSEWHPILRYGQRHDWHRLMKYPCELACPESWGNLLAFSCPPEDAKLIELIKSNLIVSPSQSTNQQKETTGSSCERFIEAAPCYTSAGHNLWLYNKASAGKQNLLLFRHPAANSTASKEYQATVRVVCDYPIKLAVALARYDPKRPFEGRGLKAEVHAGKPWSAILKHRFREDYTAIKVQFEVLECQSPSCTLEIQEMSVEEVPPDSFSRANKLYREGKYAEALETYRALQKSFPKLGIYQVNANMALAKMKSSRNISK